jgi:hypothetical protein
MSIVVVLVVVGCSTKESSPKKTNTSGQDISWSDNIIINKSELASTGVNPYFNLKPGYQLVFEGTEKGQKASNTITVLKDTKIIDGVETRVVEERALSNGTISEVSRNYFAISKTTGVVYYFGEDVDEYDASGRVTGHSGTWHAGENGAKAGIMMNSDIKKGLRYYQEVAPKVAMDRAEIVNVSESATVPAGKYTDVIKIEETTPIEPGYKAYKFYAKGIGLIKDGDLLLVSMSGQ